MGVRRVESFLLRIVVPEDEGVAPARWHGRIQHIASGSEQQIDEFAQAIAFISVHLGPRSEFVLELDSQSQVRP